MFKLTFSALSLIALMSGPALATDWTIDAGDGSHIDNPGCTGSCADAREAARAPDRRPTPGAPVRIDGEKKPSAQAGLQRERGADAAPAAPAQARLGVCCAADGLRLFRPASARDRAKGLQHCRALKAPPRCSAADRKVLRHLATTRKAGG